jgi:hypothetical protein
MNPGPNRYLTDFAGMGGLFDTAPLRRVSVRQAFAADPSSFRILPWPGVRTRPLF